MAGGDAPGRSGKRSAAVTAFLLSELLRAARSRNTRWKIYGVTGVLQRKKVLCHGHTGFKGSWFVRMLTLAGAQVIGIRFKAAHTTQYV